VSQNVSHAWISLIEPVTESVTYEAAGFEKCVSTTAILQYLISVEDFLNVVATETVPLFDHLEFKFLLEYDVFMKHQTSFAAFCTATTRTSSTLVQLHENSSTALSGTIADSKNCHQRRDRPVPYRPRTCHRRRLRQTCRAGRRPQTARRNLRYRFDPRRIDPTQ